MERGKSVSAAKWVYYAVKQRAVSGNRRTRGML